MAANEGSQMKFLIDTSNLTIEEFDEDELRDDIREEIKNDITAELESAIQERFDEIDGDLDNARDAARGLVSQAQDVLDALGEISDTAQRGFDVDDYIC